MSASRSRLGAAVAWSVWLAMFVAAVAFVAQYASNVPSWDDWDMVPTLTRNQPITWNWLWSQHNEHRVPLPSDGYELDDHGWMAELAWPHARVGVVLAHRPAAGEDTDPEAADRDRAFTAAGWEVRPATFWTAEEITSRVHSTPASATAVRHDQKNHRSSSNGETTA